MRIDDFEQHIEEKIFTRGQKYFSDGLVIDFWSERPNHYCATVAGTIYYDVEIQLDETGEILHHDCDCPYDWGEYCKHEVALLLAVREHLAQATTLKKQGQKRGLRARLRTIAKDDLIHILLGLTHEHDLWHDISRHLDGTE